MTLKGNKRKRKIENRRGKGKKKKKIFLIKKIIKIYENES